LKTTNLNVGQWGICLGIALSIVLAAEAWKLVLRFRTREESPSAPAAELRPAPQKG
jgi:hypothetical protein